MLGVGFVVGCGIWTFLEEGEGFEGQGFGWMWGGI